MIIKNPQNVFLTKFCWPSCVTSKNWPHCVWTSLCDVTFLQASSLVQLFDFFDIWHLSDILTHDLLLTLSQSITGLFFSAIISFYNFKFCVVYSQLIIQLWSPCLAYSLIDACTVKSLSQSRRNCEHPLCIFWHFLAAYHHWVSLSVWKV